LIGVASRKSLLAARIHLSTFDAQRVTVILKCISSSVRYYTRDQGAGTRASCSIGAGTGERALWWERWLMEDEDGVANGEYEDAYIYIGA
jgi:hypothetical protein